MTDKPETAEMDSADTGPLSRVYEAGYHISPAVKDADIEAVVASIRAIIEKYKGQLISEGAPAMMKLMYPMTTLEKAVKVDYDTAHFGWLKFESSSEAADELTADLKANKSILRSIVFRTVREDTRAKIKAPTLREVKRETPVARPKRIEEVSAPVSEVDLDKALEGLTAE